MSSSGAAECLRNFNICQCNFEFFTHFSSRRGFDSPISSRYLSLIKLSMQAQRMIGGDGPGRSIVSKGLGVPRKFQYL